MDTESSYNVSRDLPEDIGSSIRRRRIELNISLNQMARTCQIDPSYLSLIERGKRLRVSYPILSSIASVLKTSADELTRIG